MNVKPTAPLKKVSFSIIGLRFLLPTIAILLLFSFSQSYTQIKSLNNEQNQAVYSVSIKIEDILTSSKNAVASIAEIGNSTNIENLYIFSQAIQQTYPFFNALYGIDQSGVVFAINPANKPPANASVIYRFLKLINSNSPTIISSPFISPQTNFSTIYIIQLLNSNEAIAAEMNLSGIQNVIEDQPYVYQGGSISLVDQTGTVLASSDKDFSNSSHKIIDLPTYSTNETTKIIFEDSRFFISSAHQLSYPKWTILAKIPLSTAFGANLPFTLSAIFLILLFWGFLLIRVNKNFQFNLAAPLIRLNEAVSAFTENNFNQNNKTLEISTSVSEISELTKNFNRMAHSLELRQNALLESEEKYRKLIEISNDAICLIINDKLALVNQKFTDLFGVSIQDEVDFLRIVAPQFKEFVQGQHSRLLHNEVQNLQYQFQALNKMEQTICVDSSESTFNYNGYTAIQTSLRDISSRIASEKNERELRKLAETLRDTASVLNSTLNFREVLEQILDNVGKVVPHDTSNIMLIEQDQQTAHIVCSQGSPEFKLQSWIDSVELSIQDTFTLREMYETGKPISLPDTDEDHRWYPFSETAWIQSFAGAPIRVQGKIIGFLNLNSASPNFYNQELSERLQAFADQAGTALNNANLLNKLQASNNELQIAYETTLLGWSKALDLRDHETENHTSRVLDKTVALSRRLGITDPDLTYIRYGAILHDIGKIGIPDSILKKPGPLSSSEWAIMKKHPVYAYEILKSIPYLQKALDIPHYHHERWDGSGYPEGLTGNNIPLAARIFAVVDVWDALRSNRSYHQAISDQEIIHYLEQESGKEFDPMIIKVFIDMLTNHQE